MTVKDIIEKLDLQPHPEGGYFREVIKSDEYLETQFLPERYSGKRSFFTSIYYLLNGDQKSHFHKVNSDETWYFHLGSPVIIHMLNKETGYSKITLGNILLDGNILQYTVKRDCWFAAELVDKTSHGLFSCAVAPGFEYDDFELANRKDLTTLFPKHEKIINLLTVRGGSTD